MDERTLTSAGHVSRWFGMLMFETAEAFGTQLTEGRVRVYAADLSDLPRAVCERAVRQARRATRFFPTVAEIRQEATPPRDDVATLSWSALWRAVESVGSYASLICDDPAAGLAVMRVFGSWPAMCAAHPSSVVSRRAEYLAAYRDATRADVRVAVRLPGLCELTGPLPADDGLVWSGVLSADGTVALQRSRLSARGATTALPYGARRVTSGN